MQRYIPLYFVKFKANVKFLSFVLIFALIFIAIYNPLEISAWMQAAGTAGKKFVYSSIAVLGGIAIISLSRFGMNRFHKKHPLTFVEYASWLLGELIIIAIAYTILVKFPLADSRTFIEIFRSAILNILLILAIPYLVYYLYLALKLKNIKFNELLSEVHHGDTVSANGQTNNESGTNEQKHDNLIRFYDNKGSLRLTILKDYVYYVESASNYVVIHYNKNNKAVECQIRTTLKQVEDMLLPYNFVRCHRSFLINTNNIKIIRKEKDGFYVDFDKEGLTDIPVSKTYASQVMKIFA